MNQTTNQNTNAQTWLIAGATGGFGSKLTEKLLARGDRVVATHRKPGALDPLTEQYGDRLVPLTLEMTDAASIRAAVEKAFARVTHIDRVVGNAGYGLVGAAEALSDAAIDRQIATNLVGAMHLIRAVLPALRAQGGGRFIQISSEGGQVAYPAFSAYHATKWGIEGFIEAVALEVAPFGIEMMIVEPGPTPTDFGRGIEMAAALPDYANTPAALVQQAVLDREFALTADLGRSVDVIIAAADRASMPRRLALGSTAYGHIHDALTQRLAELEAGRDQTLSADAVSV